jgi:hypothetical protein
MAAATGKKEIKVELKLFAMKEMSAKAREFVSGDKDLKKEFEKAVTWSDKGEFDPRKYTKKDLDDEILAAARMPIKIFANRVNEAAKDKLDDKVKKQLMKDFEEASKGAINNASLRFEEIESGKGDNKKALKDGKAAFGKLDKVDFHEAFAKPHGETLDALEALRTALKSKGGDKSGAFEKARKAVNKAAEDYDKVGSEAFAAVDFMLKTARSMKGNDKADPALVDFGKQVLKDETTFDGFVKAAEAFSKVLESSVATLKANTADSAQIDGLLKEVIASNKVFQTATKVGSLVEELKPKFKAIEKDLK